MMGSEADEKTVREELRVPLSVNWGDLRLAACDVLHTLGPERGTST
jgi:hypothetical protein